MYIKYRFAMSKDRTGVFKCMRFSMSFLVIMFYENVTICSENGGEIMRYYI